MLTALLGSTPRTNGLVPVDIAYAEPAPLLQPPRVERPSTYWPASRLALTNRLWGTGYIYPGGEPETLRLARPMGVSAAASLLLVGVGAGGPAIAVARNLGAWVTGVDNDPSLLAAAQGLVSSANLGRKIVIDSWNPEAPAFEERSHHHCLAIHPFHGAAPEPVLDALSRALKPGGQLVMADLVATAPLNPDDPVVRRWAELERCDPGRVPLAANVARMLGRIGLDVRVAEDISKRHGDQVMLGWRVLMHDLGKPNRSDAGRLVAEAELWLLRRRLIRDGRLRMMRWHALGPMRGAS